MGTRMSPLDIQRRIDDAIARGVKVKAQEVRPSHLSADAPAGGEVLTYDAAEPTKMKWAASAGAAAPVAAEYVVTALHGDLTAEVLHSGLAGADLHVPKAHAVTDGDSHTAENWKVYYTEDDGAVHELALGADGKVLTSTGAASAPAFEDPPAHKDRHDPNDGDDPLDTAAPNDLAPDNVNAEGTAHSLALSDHDHAIPCDTPAEISVVVGGSEGADYNFARALHVHAINHSIANNHIVTMDSADAAAGEYAKLTANGLEGKTTSELVTDLALVQTIPFVIDGGGSEIATGIHGDIRVEYACTITRCTLLADQTGSIVIDIWKDTYANFPPTDADSITAAAVPAIAAGLKDEDDTLSGWTVSIAAGDILRYNVDSVTDIERVTISLRVTRA